MTSEAMRDPQADHLLTPLNAAFIMIDYQPVQVGSIRSMNQQEMVFNAVQSVKAARTYKLPFVHSTVNVATGKNQPTLAVLRDLLAELPVYDRTTINAWEDTEFRNAVKATGRKKLVVIALWTEACLAFPALDALAEGYEVYAVTDAVGGTSQAAHDAALRRIEQAGGKLTSKTQLFCELQRDWVRRETVPGFVEVFQHWEPARPAIDISK